MSGVENAKQTPKIKKGKQTGDAGAAKEGVVEEEISLDNDVDTETLLLGAGVTSAGQTVQRKA